MAAGAARLMVSRPPTRRPDSPASPGTGHLRRPPPVANLAGLAHTTTRPRRPRPDAGPANPTRRRTVRGSRRGTTPKQPHPTRSDPDALLGRSFRPARHPTTRRPAVLQYPQHGPDACGGRYERAADAGQVGDHHHNRTRLLDQHLPRRGPAGRPREGHRTGRDTDRAVRRRTRGDRHLAQSTLAPQPPDRRWEPRDPAPTRHGTSTAIHHDRRGQTRGCA